MRTVISFIRPVLLVAIFVFATNNVYSQTGDGGAYVTGITTARARSLVGIALGLASLIIGWRARSRASVKKTSTRYVAIAALAFGLLAVVLSIIHLANLNGGFGTGGGKAGAIVALMLGFIGIGLNGISLRGQR